ncbi:hypothetical protein MBLNU230_g2592t1 [Neophaeotheca triangularis]
MAALPFRDINVVAHPQYYAFSSPSSPTAPTLIVDRPSGDMRMSDERPTGGFRVSSIAGILGIIKLRLDSYVIVITKSKPMGRIKGHQIYKVISTEFMPLRERRISDPDEEVYLEYLEKLMKTGPMYFSYSFDMTNTFQRQAQSDPNEPLWMRADDRFYWNRFVSSPLIEFREGKAGKRMSGTAQPSVDPYILPVMYGMMSITSTSIKGNSMTYVLMTRRSRHRTGTRYFSRGIDEEGHVSNFNETEQSIILNDSASSGLASYAGDQGFQNGYAASGKETQVLSFVQTRGSVPVYWAEVNTLRYTPKLQIRGVESATAAAKKHFNEQISLYGENYMVNLVNQKGRELNVKQAYEDMVKILQSQPNQEAEADSKSNERFNVVESDSKRSWYDRLHYVYFDFHSETKGLKWHRALLLLDQLKDGLIAGGYFHGIDKPTGGVDVRSKQTAVVRTNCMDCLDRTNVIQSMLGRWTLTRQLTDLGVLRPGESAQDDQAFEHLFRNVWADNADIVSNTYSGTGALKTDFTRTGNRTRAGALQDFQNSCTRYFKNNFADGPRQDSFDLFLGAYRPETGLGAPRTIVDRRPLAVQAVPYVLGMCVFFVAISVSTNRLPNSTVWPLRVFTLVCMGLAGYTGNFIAQNGALFVNWPKLNTPQWAVEAVQDAMERTTRDPLIGRLLGRSVSDTRLGYMEEGKKRRE